MFEPLKQGAICALVIAFLAQPESPAVCVFGPMAEQS